MYKYICEMCILVQLYRMCYNILAVKKLAAGDREIYVTLIIGAAAAVPTLFVKGVCIMEDVEIILFLILLIIIYIKK